MKSLNMCNIFMYKSKRKNAETSDIIKVLNVYNTDNDILYQLIGTLEKVLFYDDYEIILTADNKKEMYIKLLELYESGLNSWIEVFEKDNQAVITPIRKYY